MKTFLQMSGFVILLAAGSSASASVAPPDGAGERIRYDRSQDDDPIMPEGGRDRPICRYRSLAGNCVRPMLTDPSDCLFVKSSKAGVPVKRSYP